MILAITFEEKNEHPPGFSTADFQEKDFIEKTILDGPIRTHPVKLVIRRRGWWHKITGKILKRDLSFIAQDGKDTSNLVAFLKGGGLNISSPNTYKMLFFQSRPRFSKDKL